MAGAKKKLNAFRSEVNTLRTVIRKTVDEALEEKLKGMKRPGKQKAGRAAAPNLKPLKDRMEELRRDVRAVEKRVRSSVDKRVKKDMGELLKSRKVERAIEDIADSRLSGINNKILMLKRAIEMLRGELESSGGKKLEHELDRSVGSLKSEIADVAVESKGQDEVFDSEIERLKRDIVGMRELEKQLKGMDMKEILRDLEIIKTKQEWIENNIERIDIKPIIQKMEELEHRIRVIGTNSPVVLE